MKRKRKKAFVVTKVKSKLVFVPPKKFWGKKITGIFLLVFGSIILSATFLYLVLFPYLLERKECPQSNLSSQMVTEIVPKRIFLPGIDLDLPVAEAKIENSQWLLPEKEAVFLPETASGKDNNFVIFGRNSPAVLGKLNQVKKTDKIYLFGQGNYLIFEVTESKTVLASDSSILEKTEEKTLTLFSTDDYLKGKRFVVKGRIVLP